MSPVHVLLDRIRQGLWLVVVVTVVAAVGAAWSAATAEPTYTGRATLSVGAQTRAPEQDAVLAMGYVEYFNEGAYQSTLRQLAGVPADITLSARLAGASPIIYIEATGGNAEAVAAAASSMANQFRTNVNASIQADQRSQIEELTRQLDVQREALWLTEAGSQDAALVSQSMASLQERINDIRGDSSNYLQELQLSAGVSSSAPSVLLNTGLALVGGLVLGALAALGLSALRDRVGSADDVRARLDSVVLAEMRAGASSSAEREIDLRLKRIANLVAPANLPRPVVVAVAAPRRTSAAGRVAEGVAARRARQGERTILVRADMDGRRDGERNVRGLADVLARRTGPTLDAVLQRGSEPKLRVLQPGVPDADPYDLLATDRLAVVLRQARALAECVVVEVPPLLETAEAQILCAAADRTVVVLARGETRNADAREALAIVAQAGHDPFGVVLVTGEIHLPAGPGTTSQAGPVVAADASLDTAPLAQQQPQDELSGLVPRQEAGPSPARPRPRSTTSTGTGRPAEPVTGQ
jgi:succinoglycan biosynthesis transport protein ExoP